jgi:hypothetical protein
MSTISPQDPRSSSAKAHADPTAPAPTTPTFWPESIGVCALRPAESTAAS